jgi:glycine dehydrogenase
MTEPSAASFASRHIGPRPADRDAMLATLGVASLDALIDEVVPPHIRRQAPLSEPRAEDEAAFLARLRAIERRNVVARSFIGMGYYGTHLPAVIQRMVLENPGWYTPYTPYQAEIAQGRLEALLNFQTMVSDLTAMDVANASLLDEATAAAEALGLLLRVRKSAGRPVFLLADSVFPQVRAVVLERARLFGRTVSLARTYSRRMTAAACSTSQPLPTGSTRPAGCSPLVPTCWLSRC